MTTTTNIITIKEPEQPVSLLKLFKKLYKEVGPTPKKFHQIECDKKDGVPFQGGQAADYLFVLGQGMMLSDFENAVEGAKAGESKTFDLVFPEDYHAKDLAGQTVQFEVTGFLHLATRDRYMGDDGFLDIGLPDTDGAMPVLRNAADFYQTRANGKRADSGGQVAAIAAPVHECLVDGNLPKQVIHVMIRLLAFRQNHGLAGAGRCATHAVGLLAIRVRAADHAQQQRIAGRARLLGGLG